MRTIPTRPSSARPIGRRAFLVTAAAGAVAVACGGGDGDDRAADTVPTVDPGGFDSDYLLLKAGFADGFQVPSMLVAGRGRQRAPFVLSNGSGTPAVNAVPASIDAVLHHPDGTTSQKTLKRHDADIPVPYYPLFFDPGATGTFQLDATVGGEVQSIQFAVVASDQVDLVQPGETMRPVDTPTTADPRGVDPLCTRFEPCPFHDLTLTEALGNGRPTALLIATPGFCQTAICGPVLELLLDAVADPAVALDVVHAEVYTDPARLLEVADPATLLAPVIGVYGMDFEPSLLVADADGVCTARLDFTYDRAELDKALSTVV